MTDIQIKIKRAFDILELLNIRGSEAETMCAARQALNEAFQAAAEEEKDG